MIQLHFSRFEGDYSIETPRRFVVSAVQRQVESAEDPPLVQFQSHQTIQPYQQLRYGATFRFVMVQSTL